MTEEAKPPICEKHGCEKYWYHPPSKKQGYWLCRICKRERGKRYTRSHPEENKSKAKGWYRDNKVHHIKNTADWKEKNPDLDKGYQEQWKLKNPERKKELGRRFVIQNPESNRIGSHKHRARKLNALVPNRPVTSDTEFERKALFDGCCFCGADEKLTLEHMVPLSKGGLHVEENLLGSCKSCNSSKHNHSVEEWFKAQPFFSEQRWQKILELTARDDKLE